MTSQLQRELVRRVQTIVSGGLLLACACGDSRRLSGPQESGPRFSVAPNGHTIMSTAPGDSLSITRPYGPAPIKAPQTRRYWVTGVPSGAYVWWERKDCNSTGVNCDDATWEVFADGPNLTSLYITFAASNDDVLLRVRAEDPATGRTGTGGVFEVLGPYAFNSGGGGQGYTGCGFADDVFYPHYGYYNNPSTGQTVARRFGRSNCGGQVNWDPNDPGQ